MFIQISTLRTLLHQRIWQLFVSFILKMKIIYIKILRFSIFKKRRWMMYSWRCSISLCFSLYQNDNFLFIKKAKMPERMWRCGILKSHLWNTRIAYVLPYITCSFTLLSILAALCVPMVQKRKVRKNVSYLSQCKIFSRRSSYQSA